MGGLNRYMSVYQRIKERLLELSEPQYAEFSAKLLPGTENIIGVRLPLLRKEAKKLVKENTWKEYLEEFNRQYVNSKDNVLFEEIMLAGMLIGLLKVKQTKKETEIVTLEEIFALITDFIPKINCWSVCDSFCAGLKIAKEYPEEVWEFLTSYLKSKEEYDIRFGIVMLLNYYLDEEHIDIVIALMDEIHHEAYYVKMAVAWNLSMCYVKFPEKTLEYLKGNNRLDDFTYNKTIQKIIESLKVSKEEKIILRAMKR